MPFDHSDATPGSFRSRADSLKCPLALSKSHRGCNRNFFGRKRRLYLRELAEKFEKVICFEPNKLFISLFKRNILNDNVELHEVGLSDTKHTAYQPLHSTVMSNKPGDIICHTLDSYHINDIDFIKIDVDGFEHRVLKGAKETLIRNNAIINIELKPEKSKERKESVHWCINFLKECGYKHKNTIKHDEIWVKS